MKMYAIFSRKRGGSNGRQKFNDCSNTISYFFILLVAIFPAQATEKKMLTEDYEKNIQFWEVIKSEIHQLPSSDFNLLSRYT